MRSGFFDAPNPHLLDRLFKTSGHRPIAAARDIVDSQGVSLLSRGQPVTGALRERLQGRLLREPLEISLAVADAVSGDWLAGRAQALVDGNPALERLGRQGAAAQVFAAMRGVELSGATRLLMALGRDDGSDACDHGIVVGFVCGALAHRAGLGQADLERAVVCGLLHDVGEMYLDPAQRDGARAMTFEEWQSTAAHPWIGQLVLSELDAYPTAITQAIHEHHERLDGSGYPEKKDAPALSPLGGIVMVAEVLVGILSHAQGPQSRAMLALRLVPGQFPKQLVALLFQVLQPDMPGHGITFNWAALQHGARYLATGLSDAAHQASRIVDMDGAAHDERSQATRIGAACRRLLVAFHATGASQLCNMDTDAVPLDELTALELEVSVQEMRWQAQALARDVMGTLSKRGLRSKALSAIASTLALAATG